MRIVLCTARKRGFAGGMGAGVAGMPGNERPGTQTTTTTSTTHLLELKLGPATEIGIGVEGSGDTILNVEGIHRGLLFRPMLASKAVWRRRMSAVGGEEMTG